MGNKDAGRAIAGLENISYHRSMGAEVTNNKNVDNTGISFVNYEVLMYFRLLRNYGLNRCLWTSNTIPPEELRLIEWNIFHYGKCAMLRPKIIRDNVKFQLPTPKIYQCNFIDVNQRNGRPERIDIINEHSKYFIIENTYEAGEFTVFSDEYLYSQSPAPFVHIAWEFANKLHELDLAFNANSHRNRMPFVFNNAAIKEDKDNRSIVYNRGTSIAEIMRGAYGRNEQFVEISESMVGKDGFMHEPRYVKNDLLDHIEAQKKLFQSYFELLGLYTNKDKTGVYTVKRLQEDGDESGDFITDTLKCNRLICMREACKTFGIDMALEIV